MRAYVSLPVPFLQEQAQWGQNAATSARIWMSFFLSWPMSLRSPSGLTEFANGIGFGMNHVFPVCGDCRTNLWLEDYLCVPLDALVEFVVRHRCVVERDNI